MNTQHPSSFHGCPYEAEEQLYVYAFLLYLRGADRKVFDAVMPWLSGVPTLRAVEQRYGTNLGEISGFIGRLADVHYYFSLWYWCLPKGMERGPSKEKLDEFELEIGIIYVETLDQFIRLLAMLAKDAAACLGAFQQDIQTKLL